MTKGSPLLNHELTSRNAPQTIRKKRVSRAGRILRSVGEWWREPRRELLKTAWEEKTGPEYQDDIAYDDAGWIPAFQKTCKGSGPLRDNKPKRRIARRLVKRLVPGANFIKCDMAVPPAAIPHGTDETNREGTLPMSPTLHCPNFLTSAMRVASIQPNRTPTRRRILDTTPSAESGCSTNDTRENLGKLHSTGDSSHK